MISTLLQNCDCEILWTAAGPQADGQKINPSPRPRNLRADAAQLDRERVCLSPM